MNHTTQKILNINGSEGEGGGQMLRTSLSLSVITGRPFRMHGIRAKRSKPGLMRQHLACVHAAARLCNAQVTGDELNSTEIEFVPGQAGAEPGTYQFAIGSAGSTGLVLQTILLPLIMAAASSEVVLQGGTHNPMAPPFPFLEEVYVPILRGMGADIEIMMERAGFMPVGGGVVRLKIGKTCSVKPLDLTERGEIIEMKAEGIRAGGLAGGIVERELRVVSKRLPIKAENLQHRTVTCCDCPGNFLAITVKSQHVTEMFTSVGEFHKRAETVANECVNEARAYLESGVPVGPHLADQLLLPLALSPGGRFVTSKPSLHTRTNLKIIEQFKLTGLPVVIQPWQKSDSEQWLVSKAPDSSD